MITIHIDPTETDPRESDRVVEQSQRYRKWLSNIIWGIIFILVVIVIFLLPACSDLQAPAAYPYQVPEKLADGWETDSFANVGLDSAQITAMMSEIQNGSYDNLYSMLIPKDRKLVFEEYFHGHDSSTVDYIASVTKSVASITIGIAIDQGYIDGPDQYLVDLLPSYSEAFKADPLKQKLHLNHLLSMTSGIEWDEETYPYGDNRNDATAMERSADPVRFILNQLVVREPRSQFQYSGANSMLLSAILQEATGMTLADYAKQNLFAPLGINKYQWWSIHSAFGCLVASLTFGLSIL